MPTTNGNGSAPPAEQAEQRRAAKRPPMGMVATGSKSDILPTYTRVNPWYVVSQGKHVLMNPDPIVRLESAGLGSHVYEEILDKDAHIGGVVDTRIVAATTLPRTVVPGNDSPEAERIAQTVALAFERWDRYEEDMANLLFCIVSGFSVGEVEYVVHEDGVVGIKRIWDCDRDAFVFDMDGNLRMLTQAAPVIGTELPARKFVVMQYRQRANNPYGVGLGRSLWWLTYLKKRGLISWLIAVEKYGVPTLVFKHPAAMPESKRQKLIDAGNKLQTDTTIAISDDIDIDTLKAVVSAAGAGQEALLLFINDEASKRVLGQTSTTDAKPMGIGSSAAGAQSEVRQDVLEHDANQLVAPCMDRTVVRWLAEFNYGPLPPELVPRLEINAAPPDDTVALATRDNTLVRMGLPIGKRYFYGTYSIPEPEPGEETINDALMEQEKASLPPGLDPAGFGGMKPGMKPGDMKRGDDDDEDDDEE